MIDLETIKREINEIEARGDTTYSICERLAWLYICRDHLEPQDNAPRITGSMYGSEFVEAASNVDYDKLMEILDEHMQAIRIVHSKEYDSVLTKIRALQNN